MSTAKEIDAVLIRRIRAREAAAWEELIARFEGRLLAFVESRLRDRAASEDVVQESFIGFLSSLPNYDQSRPLESYLFSIAAHKLTDLLRREGRRPTLPLATGSASQTDWDLPGKDRAASSIMRSGERLHMEQGAITLALQEQLSYWRNRGDWEKIKCAELLFVRGLPNKDAALKLGVSEQTVANHKFDFIAKMRANIRKQGLSVDVFPELAE